MAIEIEILSEAPFNQDMYEHNIICRVSGLDVVTMEDPPKIIAEAVRQAFEKHLRQTEEGEDDEQSGS